MKNMIKKAAFFLLMCYTLLLGFWMLFGFGRYTYPEFRYNLIPFSTIRHFLNFDQVDTSKWIINLIGNIGVFIPFGILLPILLEGRKVLSYANFIIGIFILELTQLLSRRGSFDIDDLLLNSVGFIIGYEIYKTLASLNEKHGIKSEAEYMNARDREDKRRKEEYKKNPMINLADSINRSKVGDLASLTEGGCLAKVITTVIIIGLLLILSQCS